MTWVQWGVHEKQWQTQVFQTWSQPVRARVPLCFALRLFLGHGVVPFSEQCRDDFLTIITADGSTCVGKFYFPCCHMARNRAGCRRRLCHDAGVVFLVDPSCVFVACSARYGRTMPGTALSRGSLAATFRLWRCKICATVLTIPIERRAQHATRWTQRRVTSCSCFSHLVCTLPLFSLRDVETCGRDRAVSDHLAP